ncbi:MAG: hypothetical protein MUD03_13690 [Pirellula sp.]|nr:hypothetical protein [Pirellula sp.]
MSAIASEVNKELDPTNQTKANLVRDIKATPLESAIERCRKSLLSKLSDAKDQIDKSIKEMERKSSTLAEQAKLEKDPVKKQELEDSALIHDLDAMLLSYKRDSCEELVEKAEKETDISKLADYENELNALSRVKLSSQPVPGSPPVKPTEGTFRDLHIKFTTEKNRLVNVFEDKKYAWRESSVKELLNLINDGLKVLAEPNASLPQKQVAANLLELRLTELARKLRPLSIPLTVQDLAIKKAVVDDFLKAMDGVVAVILNKFTVEADKNQINSVLPNAIQIAKGPLARLTASLGKITAATITQENESTVDAYCVQSLRLATQCVEHCASDPLLKAWDQLPDKKTPTSASLKKAIEDGLSTNFKICKYEPNSADDLIEKAAIQCKDFVDTRNLSSLVESVASLLRSSENDQLKIEFDSIVKQRYPFESSGKRFDKKEDYESVKLKLEDIIDAPQNKEDSRKNTQKHARTRKRQTYLREVQLQHSNRLLNRYLLCWPPQGRSANSWPTQQSLNSPPITWLHWRM